MEDLALTQMWVHKTLKRFLSPTNSMLTKTQDLLIASEYNAELCTKHIFFQDLVRRESEPTTSQPKARITEFGREVIWRDIF